MHETKKERDGQKERDRADSEKERNKARVALPQGWDIWLKLSHLYLHL